MKKGYVIVTDSTLDFEIGFSNPNIVVIKTPVQVAGEDYTDKSPDEFYERQREVFNYNRKLREHLRHPDKDDFKVTGGIKTITTSCPTIGMIENVIMEILDSGRDAIYVTMASTLSSTFASAARVAIDDINESGDYKNKAIAIDSLCMSAAGSLLLRLAVESCDTTEEVIEYIYQRRNDVEHLFVVDDCTAFRESGRISATILKVIDILGIKPLMRFDFNREGYREAINAKKMRSMQAAISFMVNLMRDTIDDLICIVPYAENAAGANMLADKIKRLCPEVEVLSGPEFRMGPAVGVHLGYSAIGLIFMRRPGIYPGAERHRIEQTPESSYYGI